ncbi:hypothetical protein PENVUL_c039G06299 [Penicillium vulpinum]|uniref:Uncharacterized protein n=2 Tax=Penicillium vulpinum TaxID=29845 RepID=A0A1V6RM48_9EURO|nr:hypothetical protein PENVUL_c039G06299 [Penicillium vulpinum]
MAEGYKRSLWQIAHWLPGYEIPRAYDTITCLQAWEHLHSSTVVSFNAESFHTDILSARASSPVTAYLLREQSPAIPDTFTHVLIVVIVEQEPSNDLSRPVVLTIAAVMVTRLEGEESPECCTIPVLAMTVFEQMKFRFLDAFYSQRGLVIRKTELFDFSTNEQTTKNMSTVLGIMASRQVGDPTDLTTIC